MNRAGIDFYSFQVSTLLFLLFLWCTLFILHFIPIFVIFILSFSARRAHTQSRRQELNRGGTASLSLCLLILMRVPFTVKRHKESSLTAVTSPSTLFSLEPQNGYVTEAWELILSRCAQSKPDQKVETGITKHLIRSWWNQGPRVGLAIVKHRDTVCSEELQSPL